ncbi:uncharacterized protein LOC131953016 [Physella acuta]|uniref:uncharacterized protein LOC131953016 n=1 Tax=Physella acuta TaxID=109671 RepID=UPI0027DB6F74|nr:uncharacterized protein LOC131953016 [Physella acuta]
MALTEKDKIVLSTPFGTREIQVLIGDITKLSVEEKVDLVFTSAFCCDYNPVPGTLIGSLKQNLNISVKHLASSKELDLRTHFSCWVSQKLESYLPFNRLACFEYDRGSGKLTEQLSQMFRAMMPIFNSKESSVITPLLATGNQAQSYTTVMAGMVNAACEWIRAGLPLQCLKIVLYSTNPLKLSERDANCLKLFSELKLKWNELENMTEMDSKLCDVCLSYAPEDEHLAKNVEKNLLKHSSDISIHSDIFEFNHNDVWQRQIYNVMKSSKKIIVILTPAYIASKECLEQFNIALCCNRLRKEELVLPFYMQTISSIPSYMSIVQYLDCRCLKPGENVEQVLNKACADVIDSVKHQHIDTGVDSNIDDTDKAKLAKNKNIVYDIFISYSHRHVKEPKELAQILQKKNPELNIFFDVNELKAGNLWQEALYEAVDKSHCVVTFLSSPYIQSSTCNEEFNIALARQLARDSVYLVPVLSEELKTIPRRFTSLPCISVTQENGNLDLLADELVHLALKAKEKPRSPDVKILKNKLQVRRGMEFKEKFQLDGGHVVRKVMAAKDSLKGEVVFSYETGHLNLAAITAAIMKKECPGLVCHLQSTNQSERRMHLDTADLVVFFISDQFITSHLLVEELHTVLCRQKTVKDRTIIYLIQCDHKAPVPFYFHMLPFSVSLDDIMWRQLERASSNKNPQYKVDIDGMAGTYRCLASQNLALTAAAHDAVYVLAQSGVDAALPCSLDNIVKLDNDISGLQDDQLVVHEIAVKLTPQYHVTRIENPLLDTKQNGDSAATPLNTRDNKKDNSSQHLKNNRTKQETDLQPHDAIGKDFPENQGTVILGVFTKDETNNQSVNKKAETNTKLVDINTKDETTRSTKTYTTAEPKSQSEKKSTKFCSVL